MPAFENGETLRYTQCKPKRHNQSFDGVRGNKDFIPVIPVTVILI